MALFKRKVQETVQEAVDTVKDLATKATAEKMDIWGDLAKIGTFILMTVGAVKGFSKGDRDRRHGDYIHDVPDVRTMTINNYYYGGQPRYHGRNGRKK